MFQWARNILGIGGKHETAATRNPGFTARYDNAQTTDENARNWFMSDYFSAKAANSFAVRRQLRIRSRYETSNNPYLYGIANGNADDLIGTGPTLQVQTSNDAINDRIERAWREWADEVGFVEKLRTLKMAKTIDGEGFLILKTVYSLQNPVKLYPCDIEADQVTTPMPQTAAEYWVDGLILDEVTGRPLKYHVLRYHPGDMYYPYLNQLKPDEIDTKYVIHWFQKFRPGQVRGVPVFTPSLDLFAELRAYRKAVLNNAQLAASYTAVLESEYKPGDDDDLEIVPFKKVPVDRGMTIQLPRGMKMNGFDSKQPTTTYEMFKEQCLGEAIRPLPYPMNLALGTSQKFNFSSSKLDFINYRNSMNVERADCETVALNRVFKQWYDEAIRAEVFPQVSGGIPRIEWHWPEYQSLDPVADAQADHERLSNRTMTYREFWKRRGRDYRNVFKQLSNEIKEMELLGIQPAEAIKRSISETVGDVANAA